MRQLLRISLLYTLFTTMLLGLAYPLAITGLAKLFFPAKANGQLITRNGVVVGSRLIGQTFSGDAYFHGRPSAAGNGYDAANSGGSNYGPTSQKLIDRITGDVAAAEKDNHTQSPVPVDLVTASASGLDPDISVAAAQYQIERVAHARGLSVDAVRALVQGHITPRQFGFLGEPRVNVLELNLALDELARNNR